MSVNSPTMRSGLGRSQSPTPRFSRAPRYTNSFASQMGRPLGFPANFNTAPTKVPPPKGFKPFAFSPRRALAMALGRAAGEFLFDPVMYNRSETSVPANRENWVDKGLKWLVDGIVVADPSNDGEWTFDFRKVYSPVPPAQTNVIFKESSGEQEWYGTFGGPANLGRVRWDQTEIFPPEVPVTKTTTVVSPRPFPVGDYVRPYQEPDAPPDWRGPRTREKPKHHRKPVRGVSVDITSVGVSLAANYGGRPPKGIKEMKSRSKAAAAMMFVVDWVTEGLDGLEILAIASGVDVWGKNGRLPQHVAWDLFVNGEIANLDFVEFLALFGYNFFEDMLVGRAMGAKSRALRNLGATSTTIPTFG